MLLFHIGKEAYFFTPYPHILGHLPAITPIWNDHCQVAKFPANRSSEATGRGELKTHGFAWRFFLAVLAAGADNSPGYSAGT